MSILEFIYEMIKVYFINRKGKSNYFFHLEKSLTSSTTANVREHP